MRNIFGVFFFSGEDVDKKVIVFFGGERVCLVMVCFLLKFFNLLVLDEFINYLDIIFKDIFKKVLMEYDGILVVVLYDRDFLVGLIN